ncbi:MAG: insulinase family protein, partial [bacterium]|nr:insulinase family protein [bacterium]
MNVSNYICASLLENILGEGIGARLWPIRARKNLAYHLAARATCLKQAGILHVLLKTDHSKKEKAKVALEEVLAKLYREGVGEEEFTAALIRARAHFLRRNETKEKRTYNLGFFETIGPGFRFIEDFCTHLETITREQLNNFITETLAPGKMVRVIIGPGK